MSDQPLQESAAHVIPKDALHLTATCLWCHWASPITFDEPVSHTCWEMDDPWVRRAPAISVSWLEARPYPREETT